MLLTRIVVPEIRNWLRQELEILGTPEAYDPVADDQRYLKIKGNGSLDRRGLAILKNLAAWRENEARLRNRPRGHIVNDKVLLVIARERTETFTELSHLELLSTKKVKRYGEILVTKVQDALTLSERDLPAINRKIRLNGAEKSTYERLLAHLDDIHRIQGVDPHTIGNTSEFKQLVKHYANGKTPLPEKFAGGWRSELLQQFFSPSH